MCESDYISVDSFDVDCSNGCTWGSDVSISATGKGQGRDATAADDNDLGVDRHHHYFFVDVLLVCY